jgi:hypothetical protein
MDIRLLLPEHHCIAFLCAPYPSSRPWTSVRPLLSLTGKKLSQMFAAGKIGGGVLSSPMLAGRGSARGGHLLMPGDFEIHFLSFKQKRQHLAAAGHEDQCLSELPERFTIDDSI